MATATNKFTQNLKASHKDIIAKRAAILAEDAKDAQNDLITNLKKEVRLLETKLMNLEDLSPDTTITLRITPKDFDATQWVNELHNTKVQLSLKKIELDIATATYEEFFS